MIQYKVHFVEYEKVKNKLFMCILNIYDRSVHLYIC